MYIQLSMFLFQVIDEFKKNNIPYAIVGGYAMALHGLVRATVDINLVLRLKIKDFEQAEQALLEVGLTSRIPIRAKDIITMREEYIKKRNLLAWSFVDFKNPSRQIDILITKDLNDLEVEKISVGNRKINVVTLLELKQLKIESGRPQDLIDVKNIEEKLREKK